LVSAKKTSDIKLPTILKVPNNSQLNLILDKIEYVISNGELKELFAIKELILD
jgi:hypothetical protein